ncbi:hypothetical protein P3X46_002582 [Hevea brasiliensis]|uniref:RING-type E3 ubiquitin transferase n=1 Tax=Hevea brasiliensis TaxID=3981 RepID=A0ABQ9N640_HEVBR|nr:uncharacterized protein LOC110633158 [Hevea brasiliensis]KAJ9187086.1 hypothetical protein P3X46_002582 [Hevea brasiliensis]
MERFLVRVEPLPQLELQEADCRRRRQSSSLQVYIKLSYHVHRRLICVSPNGRRTPLGSLCDQSLPVAFWLDFSLLKNKRALYNAISPRLAGLGVESHRLDRLVLKIMERVDKISYWVSKKRKFLPLLFKIVNEKISFVVDETEVIDRIMMRESERGNYGMVPTARKSRILKCVKVGDSESCTICLEQLLEFAASMPCGHVFHGSCILNWLEKSHYCPVCRFEMPTEK